ncbi:MAG: hypothetical protein AAGI22_11085 [Planctomycetota bacterium]
MLVLDEPSTGLAATDVEHLARCLGRLARRGNAVVVIEHHTELLEICDRLVELGPEGGEKGGQIVSAGTPRELAHEKGSITGPWLFRAPGEAPGSGAQVKPKAPRRKKPAAKKKATATKKKAASRKAAASRRAAR